MSSCLRIQFVSTRTRRLVTATAIIAYLLSVWGYPLPETASLDTSIAFPCQHHRCGCTSAAQCWQNCCCYSPQERIAWAAQHGVEIPREALAAMRAVEPHAMVDSQAVSEQACTACAAHDDDCRGDEQHISALAA